MPLFSPLYWYIFAIASKHQRPLIINIASSLFADCRYNPPILYAKPYLSIDDHFTSRPTEKSQSDHN